MIEDRIKRACIAYNNLRCFNQTEIGPDDKPFVIHRMALEFNEHRLPEPMADCTRIVSRLVGEEKKIVIHVDNMTRLLPNGDRHSNNEIMLQAGRVIMREIVWFNMGKDEHITTLEHLLSDSSRQAFQHGLALAADRMSGKDMK